MLILGIDTSCDDTSAAVVEDGKKIVSNIVSSQNKIHEKYGGVVPEIASRRHIEMIWPVVQEALTQAKAALKDISAIAVCDGPGLIGSLLVGVCFSKSLAFASNIPFVAVHHLEGHIFSGFLEEPVPEYPFIALIVSGGHTSICRVDGFGRYRELGRTVDDAAGEAFDKVAKLLGLGYPGGPFIDALSKEGDPDEVAFPRPKLAKNLDFSFSGLKTAVVTYVKKNPEIRREDIAASFQAAVIDVLLLKTMNAARQEGVQRIVLAGGVSANSALRAEVMKRAKQQGIGVYLPSPQLCTDNAAMIASAGFFHAQQGNFADLNLNPRASMPLLSMYEKM